MKLLKAVLYLLSKGNWITICVIRGYIYKIHGASFPYCQEILSSTPSNISTNKNKVIILYDIHKIQHQQLSSMTCTLYSVQCMNH